MDLTSILYDERKPKIHLWNPRLKYKGTYSDDTLQDCKCELLLYQQVEHMSHMNISSRSASI